MSTTSSFASRIVRAARFDRSLYEEVETDTGATIQALAVVVASAVAAGLGSGDLGALVPISLFALIGWFLWALLTCLLGTKVVPERETRSDLGEMLRVTGFSASPGLLRVLGAIPALNAPVFLLTGVWMLLTMIVAIRQALDYKSTLRAVVVAALGWLIFFGIGAVAGGFFPADL